MADLAITVDMSSVTQAEKKVNSFQNQLSRLIKKQREGAISDEAFAKGKLEIKRAYQEVGVSSQKASGQVEKYVRQMNEAKKAQDRAADMQKWFTNQRRKMRMMEESARLDQQQIRSQERLREKYVPLYAASKRYERALEEINQAHREGVFSTQQYNNAIEQLNADFARTRQVGVGNTRSMNNFGVAMQQSGYQVGDFLVQVQSGTNAFVAFGQQATQLVGILPMFADQIKFLSSTALIGLSAGLGIVIPLVTALAGAFMRTRQEAEGAEDSLDTFTQSLESAASALDISKKPLEDLREEFGRYADEVQRASEVLAKAELSSAMRSFDSAAKSIRSNLSEVDQAAQELNEEYENYANLQDILGEKTVRNASRFNESERAIERTSQKLEEAANSLELTSLGAVKLSNSLRDFESAKGVESIADAASETLDLISDLYDETEKLPPEVSKIVVELEEVLRQAGLATIAMEDVKDTTSGAADEAGRFADNLKLGIGYLSESVRAGVSAGAIPPQALQDLPETDAEAAYKRILENRRREARRDNDAGSGGGGTSPQDYLQSLVKEAKFKREIVDLTDAQAERAERRKQIIDKLGVTEDALTQSQREQITQILNLEQQTKRLTEAQRENERQAKFLEDTMTKSFMAMIDGSQSVADAFRNMMRQILAQVVEQAVARPIASGILGFLGFANGAAFQNGKVTPFADGGVVNQPTVFPMANGAGLMGEAGPEAVMPLKRGKDGKLGVQAQGNSQPVVINQTFQFSANGDDSVKRIITQEAPKIANLTKRQILDERSRGGAWKKTFG